MLDVRHVMMMVLLNVTMVDMVLMLVMRLDVPVVNLVLKVMKRLYVAIRVTVAFMYSFRLSLIQSIDDLAREILAIQFRAKIVVEIILERAVALTTVQGQIIGIGVHFRVRSRQSNFVEVCRRFLISVRGRVLA